MFSGFDSDYSTFILLATIVSFLLGLLLGYIIWGAAMARMKKELQAAQAELGNLKKEHATLREKHTVTESELAKCQETSAKLDEKVRKLTSEKGQIQSDMIIARKERDEAIADFKAIDNESSFFITELGNELKKVKSSGMAFGAAAPVDPDDLKKIEGIGPKIEGLLNDGGIHTWAQLAATAVDRLQSILDAAGKRYQVHNPGTWPEQAKMAAEGRWEELKKWQDELDGGK